VSDARLFKCPYLGGHVELTSERERHIAIGHPDLLPEHLSCISDTVLEPDCVRRDIRFSNTWLLNRWFPHLRGGKHVVVVVASEAGGHERRWIVTAYLTRRLAHGAILEWTKD
jgi:hypothetical protein